MNTRIIAEATARLASACELPTCRILYTRSPQASQTRSVPGSVGELSAHHNELVRGQNKGSCRAPTGGSIIQAGKWKGDYNYLALLELFFMWPRHGSAGLGLCHYLGQARGW